VKTRNIWNRERDVKERYENFVQIIKGKLEETTPGRKDKNKTSQMDDMGKIGNKEKKTEYVWWNSECDKAIRIRKAKLLKWKFCKTEETYLEYKRGAIIYKALIRSGMEYGAFLFHKLKMKQAQELEKIQYRAIRGALGYRSSTQPM
jgi:hypothetical protein